MWRLQLVVATLIWNTISSQPVSDSDGRPSTLNRPPGAECCPCPDAAAPSVVSFARAAPVDDCPCRLRHPDADGATSVFLPRTVRPLRPFITTDKSKEELKPLLIPEVGLASSMLETLREVTNEEYEEALARDAARNAARVSELGDAQPGVASNVLTIIVNPGESDPKDATPEASQPFETICTPSLEQVGKSVVSSSFKPTKIFTTRIPIDMDNGASDVKEKVIPLNKALDGLTLKTSPSVLKLFPARKSQGTNIQSLLKLKSSKVPNEAVKGSKKLEDILKPKLPSLKLDLGIPKLNIPILKKSLQRNPIRKTPAINDNDPASSINQENLTKPTGKTTIPTFNLKSLLSSRDVNKNPLSLKNLLKLKDVELIPAKPPTLNFPGLRLLPPIKVNKPAIDVFKQPKIQSERQTKNCNKDVTDTMSKNKETNVQERTVHTKILDALPHASEMNQVFVLNDNNIETATTGVNSGNFVQTKNKPIKTKILNTLPSASKHNTLPTQLENMSENSEFEDSNMDVLPSASEQQEVGTNNMNAITDNQINTEILNELPNKSQENRIIVENENSMDQINANINSEDTIVEIDLRPNIEETTTEPGDKLSKDNIEHVSTNSVEITLDNDENNDVEEMEIVVQPATNIELSDSTSDQEELDLEIDDDDSSKFELQSFTSNVDGENSADDEQNEDFDLFDPNNDINNNDGETNVNELFRENSLDSVPETSNQNIQIASLEDIEGKNVIKEDSLIIGNVSEEKGPINDQKQDLLSSIKEKISLKLNSLKKIDGLFPVSKYVKPTMSLKEKEKTTINSDEFTDIGSLTEDTSKFPDTEKSAEIVPCETKQLEIQDLQNMSDSLLRKTESENISITASSETESTQDTTAGFNKESENKRGDMDMNTSATTLHEDFLSIRDEEENDENNMHSSKNIASEKLKPNIGASSDNTCPSNFKTTSPESLDKNVKIMSGIPDAETDEMVSGASETIFKTVPEPKSSAAKNLGSPLLQQSIVVQPPSVLPPLPSLDLSNLPTLDDIRSGISSLLGGMARGAEDETISSTDFDSGEECSDTNPVMSADASTTNTRTAFPLLRPLEDINLDIFQINPIQGSPLNLNSFKTKLALPKSLNLKPMKLQSTLGGRNGGLLGASFTFGPEKPTQPRKAVNKLSSTLNRQGFDVLGNPLANMPSLGDLRSKVRANTESLLKTAPLNSGISGPLKDTLRTTEKFGNSLRSHTENTMKNIQQSLSSTLNEARVLASGRNSIGEKFAKPQDLIEMVSSAHEDMNDKLYAIHIDLQDRLSSLHDRIADQSKLPIPILQSPLLSRSERMQDNSLGSMRGRNDMQRPSSQNRKPSPKLIVRKKKPAARVNKPMSKEPEKVRPFKLSKAASSLTPKAVEVPKLTATSSKPPFLRPLARDKNVKLKEIAPIFATEERKMPSRRLLKPLAVQTKVSIATTPPPASFRARRPIAAGQRLTAPSPSQFNVNQRKTKPRLTPSFISMGDSRSFASEPQPLKLPAPIASSSSMDHSLFDSEENCQTRTIISSSQSPQSSLRQFTLGNPLKKTVAQPSKLGSLNSSSKHLAKPTESPLASKMREAIRIRLSRPIHSLKKVDEEKGDLNKPRQEDMSKSASENKRVMVKTEPMKENVSYKCKMMCVRE